MSKTHLNLGDRQILEHELNSHTSLSAIGKKLGKSSSTISREIQKHAIPSTKSPPFNAHNACLKRFNCQLSRICRNPDCNLRRRCSTCKLCNNVCDEFQEELCSSLSRAPYVCNGCDKQHKCTLNRRYYTALNADKKYREVLSVSRSGVNLTEEEHLWLDEMLSPYLKNGKSIHSFVISRANELPVCERSIYNYVNGSLFTARNIDMPRTVRMRVRKKTVEHKVDKQCYINRTYNDYKKFIEEHPDILAVEGDSVEGIKGGKVLLTLQFVTCDLMLAFLRDHNDSKSVADRFDLLYTVAGHVLFKKMFPALLCDRGSEFSNPMAIELNKDGLLRTKVFYCDPRCPSQKPHVELNHTYIRKILPKGTSFNNLVQEDIDLMMSMINSYPRGSLGEKTPIEVFRYLYGNDLLDQLGIRLIPLNDVILTPNLLRAKVNGSTSNNKEIL